MTTVLPNLNFLDAWYISLLQTLKVQVDKIVSEIAFNVNQITANTISIATNTANIATNTSNIATNTANIVTNTANIATNTANIATNTTSISTMAANLNALAAMNPVTSFAAANGTYASGTNITFSVATGPTLVWSGDTITLPAGYYRFVLNSQIVTDNAVTIGDKRWFNVLVNGVKIAWDTSDFAVTSTIRALKNIVATTAGASSTVLRTMSSTIVIYANFVSSTNIQVQWMATGTSTTITYNAANCAAQSNLSYANVIDVSGYHNV